MAEINLLQNTRTESPESKTYGVLNTIGYILLFLAVVSAGFLFFLNSSLDKQIAAQAADSSAAQNQVESTGRYTDLVMSQQRLHDLTQLMANRYDWSVVLSNLGSATLKGVTYDHMTLNADGTGNLAGSAASFKELYKYIQGLTSDQFSSYIASTKLVNVSLGDHGGISFNMDVMFKSDFWKPLQGAAGIFNGSQSGGQVPSANSQVQQVPTQGSPLSPSANNTTTK